VIVLIVHEDAAVLKAIPAFLQKRHEVLSCQSAAAALALVKEKTIDVALVSPRLSDLAPLELIRQAMVLSPVTSFVTMPSEQEKDFASEAIRLAADEFFAKLTKDGKTDLNATLEALEYRILLETLTLHGFNQVKAAEALGITRGALQYKMKKYDLFTDENKKAA
jgi:DNA-binding NtrC family response regulator